MTDLGLAFCGGLLGSAHCVGMCGAFALAIGSGGRGLSDHLLRQLAYTLGRIFTYCCLGLTAAFCGSQLMRYLPTWVPMQSTLSLLAGSVLIVQGLAILGFPLLRWKVAGTCQAASALRTILTAPHLSSVFLAGVATGFLPCALIYAYLALAARTGDLFSGMFIMVALGAGTAPLMILTGLSVSTLALSTRRHVIRFAAAMVLLTGLITLGRGVAYWSAPDNVPQKCPLCQSRS